MRLIDADALESRMYHEAFEKDSDMQKWDSGCWIRYKMFEQVLKQTPVIDAYTEQQVRDAYTVGFGDVKSVVNQWIPVSERLPEGGEVVIAIGKKGTWDVGTYRGFLGDNIHRWQWKKNTIKTVYWWMYKKGLLPEPYKGDEE